MLNMHAQLIHVGEGCDEIIENCPLKYLRDFFFFQAEDGIRDHCVTGVQTCALPIYGLGLLAKALLRQQAEAMQPTLFEEIQEEAKYRVQEIEERMGVLRQDVERTRDLLRSEERRVGKEGRSRGAPYH